MCYPIDEFRDCINVKYKNIQNTRVFFIVVNNKNFVILDIVRTMVLWGLVDFCSMN